MKPNPELEAKVKTKHKELWELLQDPNSIGVKLSRADAEQLINEYRTLKAERIKHD